MIQLHCSQFTHLTLAHRSPFSFLHSQCSATQLSFSLWKMIHSWSFPPAFLMESFSFSEMKFSSNITTSSVKCLTHQEQHHCLQTGTQHTALGWHLSAFSEERKLTLYLHQLSVTHQAGSLLNHKDLQWMSSKHPDLKSRKKQKNKKNFSSCIAFRRYKVSLWKVLLVVYINWSLEWDMKKKVSEYLQYLKQMTKY